VYNIPYLPVGECTVSTEKAGFRRAEATNVIVNVNSVLDINIKLAVGAIDQKIEVAAVAPLLETQGSNLGRVEPTKAIMDLPPLLTCGLRSNMNFISLTPGAIGSSRNPRIAGGLENGQSEQLDGAESQSERRNDAAMNGISVEAVEEFKVQSGAYSAEYGQTSNGVINWVTKSGTNDQHCSAFLFWRNEFFNARGFTFSGYVCYAGKLHTRRGDHHSVTESEMEWRLCGYLECPSSQSRGVSLAEHGRVWQYAALFALVAGTEDDQRRHVGPEEFQCHREKVLRAPGFGVQRFEPCRDTWADHQLDLWYDYAGTEQQPAEYPVWG
jgi:hypothetical protein